MSLSGCVNLLLCACENTTPFKVWGGCVSGCFGYVFMFVLCETLLSGKLFLFVSVVKSEPFWNNFTIVLVLLIRSGQIEFRLGFAWNLVWLIIHSV